jgi:hypothetical protein
MREYGWFACFNQSVERSGYHLTLGGSVLNKGFSEKDLDLYFLPMGQGPENPTELIQFLTKLWGTGEDLFKEYAKDFPEIMDTDEFIRFKNHHIYHPDLYHVEGILVDRAFRYKVTYVGPPVVAPDKNLQPSVYSHKLKYMRGSDRIDVFIIGNQEGV